MEEELMKELFNNGNNDNDFWILAILFLFLLDFPRKQDPIVVNINLGEW